MNKAAARGAVYKILIGASFLLVVLPISGLIHVLRAACHNSWADIACLIVPTHDDISTHLLSYILAAIVVAGAYRGYRMWLAQRSAVKSLSENLIQLGTPSGQCQAISIHALRHKAILVDHATPFCFCSGYIYPRIYLSRGMMERLTSEELEAVLLHEKYHLEKRDPLKMLVGSIFVSALFFVPTLRELYQRYLVEKELAADLNAIEYQGHKRGIAGALYKSLEQEAVAVSNSVASSDSFLEARIDNLVEADSSRQPWISARGIAVSILGIALLVFATLAPLPTHST